MSNMEIMILRNGQLWARTNVMDHTLADTYSLLLIPGEELPVWPGQPERGKAWELQTDGQGGVTWVEVDRPLTQEERIETLTEELDTYKYPAWVQPLGAHDAYPIDSRVSHKGKRWTSTVDNNVWEPGVYGWVA